jgi:hypothetical protein
MQSSKEQKLIDIMFQIAIASKEWEAIQKMDREEHTEWIRQQLIGCGVEVKPIGMSHAVLQD